NGAAALKRLPFPETARQPRNESHLPLTAHTHPRTGGRAVRRPGFRWHSHELLVDAATQVPGWSMLLLVSRVRGEIGARLTHMRDGGVERGPQRGPDVMQCARGMRLPG